MSSGCVAMWGMNHCGNNVAAVAKAVDKAFFTFSSVDILTLLITSPMSPGATLPTPTKVTIELRTDKVELPETNNNI